MRCWRVGTTTRATAAASCACALLPCCAVAASCTARRCASGVNGVPFFALKRARQQHRAHAHARSQPSSITTSSLPNASSDNINNSDSSSHHHAANERLSTAAATAAPLPPLRCPGGPRMNAEALKHIYKVPHAGYLAKYDQRFILNLKLTHQLACHLTRTTLRAHDKVLLELGPGAGSMTRSLLTRPCVGVLGVECDERFNAHLEQIRRCTDGKFQWVNADVLQCDEVALLRRAFPRFVAQHLRRRPVVDPNEHTHNHNSEYNNNSNNDNDDGGGSSNVHGDAHGCDGAPLRSAARERILRRRQQRYGSGASSQRSGGGGDDDDDARAAQQRTSPNAAFDVSEHWWADGDAKVEVVANLPFDLITELLMRYAVDCSRMTGLFAFGRVPLHIFTQKEVADRIAAAAGSVHFSRLSVLCQCYFHVRVKQTFSEYTYYPRTEVRGAMLTLEPRAQPLQAGLDGAALIHFSDLLMKPGQRGMTLHKALLRFMPPEVAQYALQETRIDGAVTVLDLTVEEVAKLTVLWRQFLLASQQQQQQQQQQQPQYNTHTV